MAFTQQWSFFMAKHTPEMVAERYHTTAENVLRWIHDGRLRAINISGGTRPRYLIDDQDLVAFDQSHAVGPGVSNGQTQKPRRRRRGTTTRDYVGELLP